VTDILVRSFIKRKIDKQLITGLAKKVLKGENNKIGELSFVIVGKKRIRTERKIINK